jgi:hypothetical protein
MAWGTAQASREQANQFKKELKPPGREPFAPSFLKHSDEQTVVALAAVFDAIRRWDLGAFPFDDWGVLAAPRFLGRETIAAAVERFLQEGAWGVSPHVIPHRSLHSMSGTLSQALKLHGPNFGVGGGPHAASEAALMATAVLADRKAAGLWLVITGWNPELVPSRGGGFLTHDGVPICRAVALALSSRPSNWEGVTFRVDPGSRNGASSPRRSAIGIAEVPTFSLEELFGILHTAPPEYALFALSGGGHLEWHNPPKSSETLQ